MKFKKKPEIIDAFKYTRDNATETLRWMFPDLEEDASANQDTIKAIEIDMHIAPGDWIIRGKGIEFYPCHPDLFEMCYEQV